MKLTVTVSLLFFVSLCFCYEVYLGVEKHGLPKEKIVITDKEIQKFGILSFAELLKVFNVNIYTRSDAQQDISLSGGSFQQIKVLLNGVPINDPQTGHHNFNLPVNLDDIEYIEIIQNDNLTKYGNSAFSGVISIVTKKSKPNFIKASYGSFNTINTSVNLQSQHNSLRFSFGKSDGYRHNTDFLSYNVLYDGRFNNTDVTFGVLDRRFGAQDFYVLGRKEYEQIRTILCSVSPKINFKNNILLKTHLFFRTGYDFYTTQRTTPTVYSNYHNSYLYGINSSVDLTFKNFSLQPTVEVLFKNLDSKGFSSIFAWRGLGEFYDYEIKTGLSCLFTYKKFSFDTSLVGNYYSRYGFIPQIGTKVSCDIFDFLRIFAVVANIHRTPSYTELYYWDPAHQADDKLKVEKTTLYRSGFSAKFLEMLNFSISGFTYDASDFIDWQRTKNTTKWYIANIAKVKTYGGEVRGSVNFKNFGFQLYYDYVKKDLKLDNTKELKYIENYPLHSLGVILYFPKFVGFDVTISNSFRNYTNTQPQQIILTNLSIVKKLKSFDITMSIENLFDIKYEEIKGLQAPPRKILSSLNFYF